MPPTDELMGKVRRHKICFEPLIVNATPPEMVKGFFYSLLPEEEQPYINKDVLKLLHPVILDGLASKKLKVFLRNTVAVKPGRETHATARSVSELVKCLLPCRRFQEKRSEIADKFSSIIHQTTDAYVYKEDTTTTKFSFKTWDKLIKMVTDFMKDPHVNRIEVIALGYVYRLVVFWTSKRASKRPIKQEQHDDHYVKLIKSENQCMLNSVDAMMERHLQRSREEKEAFERLKKENEELKDAFKQLQEENKQVKDAVATAIRCPINGVVTKIDAVVGPEGHTFDKKAIYQWFKHGHFTNPLTRTTLGPELLFPNRAINDLATFYIDKFGSEI